LQQEILGKFDKIPIKSQYAIRGLFYWVFS